MIKQFTFKLEWWEAIKASPTALATAIPYAILDLAFDGKEPERVDVGLALTMLRRQIDEMIKAEEYRVKVLRENGKKGGRPKTKQNQTKPKETNRFFCSENQVVSEVNSVTNAHARNNNNINNNINILDLENNIKKESKKKERPSSVEEVRLYMFGRMTYDGFEAVRAGELAQRESDKYFDYFTANGWRVGRNPMKDWKAACRNWLKHIGQYDTSNRKSFAQEARDTRAREAANVLAGMLRGTDEADSSDNLF